MLRSLVGSEMCIRDRVEKRMKEVSQMWAGFSEVAAAQPEHAWFPTRRSADEIQHASPENRYVGWPYTKYHCSVIDVDQAAAVIIMSVAEARRRGVPEARWVYLHGCAETVEKDLLLREDLGSSPAIRRMGEVCFADAGVTVDQIRYFDLYSCFPCAVRIASRELGIDPVLAADGSRMTLTGGLAFHGGPGANYTMHSLAAMIHTLKRAPGEFGLVTANGGVLSKHAAGVYSTTPYSVTHPKAKHWSRTDPLVYQAELDKAPNVTVAEAPRGLGTIETYTVVHGRDGPRHALCIGRLDDSTRFAAISREPTLMSRLIREEGLGARVFVEPAEGGKGPNSFVLLNLETSRL
eukprot:TRINITY_DN30388_c0_g1_i2.p1 TRINITY_DN30388_c0_g1~~TRINITY_DN30388_c0_g1_i2.p1  ORF type:complete len:350 (+),score=72.05 TRINITY_DN30388_c0_g1_i2:157-1206(+)